MCILLYKLSWVTSVGDKSNKISKGDSGGSGGSSRTSDLDAVIFLLLVFFFDKGPENYS